MVSSVWCTGHNQSERICIAKNLCLAGRQFIFFHDERRSVQLTGAEDGRPLQDLSTAAGHDGFSFELIQVNASAYSEFTAGRPVRLLRRPTLLYARLKPDNLMHLLHDELLPLKATVQYVSMFTAEPVDLLPFDEYASPDELPLSRLFYEKTLGRYRLVRPADAEEVTCFRSAFVGLRRDTVWYDYGFHSSQHVLPRDEAQKSAIRRFTREIRDQLLGAETEACTERHVTLIDRRHTRKILNQPQLIEQLEAHFKLTVIKLDLDLDEPGHTEKMLRQLACSQALVGMHGAGLALAAFLPESAVLVELFPYGVDAGLLQPYRYLCEIYRLRYVHWQNQLRENTVGHPEYEAHLGGLRELDARRRFEVLSTDEPLAPFRCCEEPRFLYRIYQDTLVDVDSLKHQLDSLDAHQADGTTRSNKIAPGPVQRPACEPSSENGQRSFRVSWQPPFNLDYYEHGPVAYQLLWQGTDAGPAYRHRTANLFHQVQSPNESRPQLVWVNCVCDRREGAFNKVPLLC